MVVVVVLAEVLVEAEVGICVVVLVWVVFVVAPPEVVCGSGVVTPPRHCFQDQHHRHQHS